MQGHAVRRCLVRAPSWVTISLYLPCTCPLVTSGHHDTDEGPSALQWGTATWLHSLGPKEMSGWEVSLPCPASGLRRPPNSPPITPSA